MLTIEALRLVFTILLPCLAGGCVMTVTDAPQAQAQPGIALKVVLVAGDDSLAVFDNATARLADDLRTRAHVPPADLHRLSARDEEIDRGAIPATRRGVIDAISGLHAQASDTCLVYATSHGMPRRGLALAASDDTLLPNLLDAAVQRGCGAAPTVLVLSGCFSGVYANAPVARANRIVITAARADRTSFGCGADFTYTFFDECFLNSMEAASGSATWREAFGQAKQCVAARERDMHIIPSEPQSAFGATVADLKLPWAPAR